MAANTKTARKRAARYKFIEQYERAKQEVFALIDSYVEQRLGANSQVVRIDGKDLVEYAAVALKDKISFLMDRVPSRSARIREGEVRFYHNLLATNAFELRLEDFFGPNRKYSPRLNPGEIGAERQGIYSEWHRFVDKIKVAEDEKAIIKEFHAEDYLNTRVSLNTFVKEGAQILQSLPRQNSRRRRHEAAAYLAGRRFVRLIQELGLDRR